VRRVLHGHRGYKDNLHVALAGGKHLRGKKDRAGIGELLHPLAFAFKRGSQREDAFGRRFGV